MAVCIRALFTKPASIFGLVEKALEDAIFIEWSGASSFEEILARQSSHSPTWDSSLWDFWFSMHFSHSAA